MEKRTLLAVVLSVIVISGGYLIQSWFFPSPRSAGQNTAPVQTTQPATPVTTVPQATPSVPAGTGSAVLPAVESAPVAEERVEVKTDLLQVVLSNKGGDVVSYKLLKHKDGNDYVQMVLPGQTESHAFTIALGQYGAKPIEDYFNLRKVSDQVVEFYRDYQLPSAAGATPTQFRLTKRYEFRPGEYMFELSVTVDSGYASNALNFNGAAYTLEFGPQIGPKFKKLSQQYDYRRYVTFAEGKRKNEKIKENSVLTIPNRVSWAAISGKYFTFIAIPDATQYTLGFATTPLPGVPESSRLFMTRPAQNAAKYTDTYRFYLGPKTQKALDVYDSSDKNSYKLRDLRLGAADDSSGFFAPLEVVMKWFLVLFYRVTPNYGVAIILLTILVKVLLFPLTKKGSEGTIRMQSLSPKIKEIQEKYRDNPNKMNVEMAALYKKEGYNPLSGCLPLLLQIPIFFAMYNLFNNHFELRGAMFIPGWIPDLSIPESVWNFAPFRLPLLGWSDLRVLPFLYLGSQLLYGKVTQTPDQQGNAQMKIMLYLMPVMFFFMLYDVPAGLLLYWIMSNLLTMVQQVIINKYLAKKRAHLQATATTTNNVIAPKKRKK